MRYDDVEFRLDDSLYPVSNVSLSMDGVPVGEVDPPGIFDSVRDFQISCSFETDPEMLNSWWRHENRARIVPCPWIPWSETYYLNGLSFESMTLDGLSFESVSEEGFGFVMSGQAEKGPRFGLLESLGWWCRRIVRVVRDVFTRTE